MVQTLEESLKRNAILEQEVSYLKEELAQLKRMLFGSKKERFIPVDSAQQSLFDIKEAPAVTEQETITVKRKKPAKTGKAKRLLLPDHLPRKASVIEPEDLNPEQCIKIGEKVSEVLEYTPGKLWVCKTIRPVYKQEEEIKVAELPTQVIPGGNAGASLLAFLLVSKFADHLPFYRQVQMLKREGMKIPESTITGWFSKTCDLLEPLYDRMLTRIRGSNYIQADESPIPVLNKDKPGSTHKGYHWVYHLPKEQVIIFQYDQSRGRSVPTARLEGFSGCLQTDGYAGYNELANKEEITHIACMAHARRKFDIAKENDPDRASYALAQIQKLYAIERECRENKLTNEEIKTRRLEKSAPILEALKTWMIEQSVQVLPKSSIGKAVAYSLKLWPKLSAYLHNAEWYIDNNLIENKIRPLAIGRKNYLFAGSHKAAQQAAMIYSFLGTCKLNDIQPLQWLTHTLKQLPETKINDLDKLLPINNKN